MFYKFLILSDLKSCKILLYLSLLFVWSSTKTDEVLKNEESIDTELALLLSHPALKNVDLKMVELINNEIIHKFKAVG